MAPFFLPPPAINFNTFNFAFDKLIKRNFHISISWDSLIISRVVKNIPMWNGDITCSHKKKPAV